MKKKMIILSIAVSAALIIIYIFTIGRYKGEKAGEIGLKYGIKYHILQSDVVQKAREERGVIYDFSQGKFKNLFSHFGFIVCSDLIDIALSKAGYPLEYEMKNDYKLNKNKYNDVRGRPDSPLKRQNRAMRFPRVRATTFPTF